MLEDLYKENCIRTFTGKYLNILNPDPDMICIEDIAHALSYQPRFAGHLPKRYTVADHSIMVCYHLSKWPELQLCGLLHDASEAYLMDMPSPIKKLLPQYSELEDRLMAVIAKKFGFQWPLPAQVKIIDRQCLEWEWTNLMLTDGDILPIEQHHDLIRAEFLVLYYKHR